MAGARPRVLLIGDTLNLGGTEGQFAEIACRLDRSRWDVDVACLRAEGPLRARLEAAGLKPWSCGRGSFKSPQFPLAILSLARRMRRDRVRVVHTFDFYSNILGLPAARLAGVPVRVASQRELGELRSARLQGFHTRLLSLATRVVVNSPAVLDRLALSRVGRARRVEVILNGVDRAKFHPAPPPLPPGAPTIGMLANLRPEKGHDVLLKAAKRVIHAVPGVRFSIWGSGPLKDELEPLVEAEGLRGHVTLHGATADPAAVYRTFDVFVLPSRSEATSNVLLEAMASGLPIVASAVGGTPEILDRGEAGLLVPPDDPNALAAALIDILASPARARALAERARNRVVAEYDMDRMVTRIEGLYTSLLTST